MSEDISGKYFLVNKHLIIKKKKNGKVYKKRRYLFDDTDLELAEELGIKFASGEKDKRLCGDDFLLVKVVKEFSQPKQEEPHE